MNIRRSCFLMFSVIAAGSMAAPASAATVTSQVFSSASNIVAPSSSQTGSLSGNALFSLDTSTNTLTITLTNTQSIATMNGSELMGVWWNTSGTTFSGTFSTVVQGAGSTVIPAGGDVGAFAYSTNGPASLSTYGVSAAGLGLTYDTIKLLGPAGTNGTSSGIDGPDGGLVGTGGPGANIPSNKPIIQNQIVYTFTNVSGLNFSGNNITNLSDIKFFYGTTLGDTTPPAVPLPAAAWMGSASLAGLAALRQIRRRACRD